MDMESGKKAKREGFSRLFQASVPGLDAKRRACGQGKAKNRRWTAGQNAVGQHNILCCALAAQRTIQNCRFSSKKSDILHKIDKKLLKVCQFANFNKIFPCFCTLKTALQRQILSGCLLTEPQDIVIIENAQPQFSVWEAKTVADAIVRRSRAA